MNTEIQTQKEHIEKLIKLTQENPDLRIVPMVNSDVVQDDGHAYWTGKFEEPEIDEVYYTEERIYIKSDEDLLDEYMDKLDDNKMSNEALEKLATQKINDLPWEKVIIINIVEPLN